MKRILKDCIHLQHRSKKYSLIKNQYIRKFVAAVMLLVFAVSITPTIVFHNWFADHTDTVKKSSATKEEQVGKRTFNCHCDNIVAESPFTEPSRILFAPSEKIISLSKAEKQVQFASSQNIIHSLRGPPAV